ncbi:MAG: hypothetical protein WBD36_02320 [Bacteroidota bacterium]
MKRYHRFLSALFLIASGEQAVSQTTITSQQLVGRWESMNPTKGGLASTFEVVNDTLCVRIFGVLVDGKYRIQGDSLYQSMADTPTKEVGVWFVVAGDSMVTDKRLNGPKTVMRRAVPRTPMDKTVEGVWWYRHDTGTTAFEEYTPDGIFRFRIYMSRDSTVYSIAGDSLTMRSLKPGGKVSKYRIVVTDSSLLMFSPRAKNPQVFRRVKIAEDSRDDRFSNGFGLSYQQTLLAEGLDRAAGVNPAQSNKDAMIKDLNIIAAQAYQYRVRPSTMGGGQGSYTGFSISSRMKSNGNGVYTATATADSVSLAAISSLNANNTITVVVNEKGRLVNWVFAGDFR